MKYICPQYKTCKRTSNCRHRGPHAHDPVNCKECFSIEPPCPACVSIATLPEVEQITLAVEDL